MLSRYTGCLALTMAAAEPPHSPDTRSVSKPTTFLSTESAFWPPAWRSRHVRSNRKYVRTNSRRRLLAKFPAIRAVQAAFSCAISPAKGPQCPQYSSHVTLVTRIRRPAVTSRAVRRRVSLNALRTRRWLYLCKRSTGRPFDTTATVGTVPIGCPRGSQAASGPKCGKSHGRCLGSCRHRRGPLGRNDVRWISDAR